MSKYKRLTQKSNNGVWGIDGKLVNQRQNGDKVFAEAFGIIINRLAELEDKIENGTLIEFPRIVKNVGYYSFWSVEYINKKFGSVSVEFFATKAEAEKKLKELQGND